MGGWEDGRMGGWEDGRMWSVTCLQKRRLGPRKLAFLWAPGCKGKFMKRSILFITFLIIIVAVAFMPETAWAAPGGKIVSGLFKTPWGRVLLGVLTVIFAPLIIYVVIKEWRAEKVALAHLRRLATIDPSFDWMPLKERVTGCYQRVHSAWNVQDMSQASEWMTSWYWQNQQLAHLNQWEKDGLVNHCRVKSINRVRPLFVKYQAGENGTSEGSRLVVAISAKMEDYLAERATGKVVEGNKGFADTEHVWTFVLQQGKWVVSNIEAGSMSLTYARMLSEVPELLPEPNKVAQPATRSAA
jgi:hypothetical protein